MVNVLTIFFAEYKNAVPCCLKSLQVFFLTRLSFPKTPADLWKETSNYTVASNSWLNL